MRTYLYSVLSRGMLVDIAPSKDFCVRFLEHLWWRLDRAIDPEILQASALAGCSDALKAGMRALSTIMLGLNALLIVFQLYEEAYREYGFARDSVLRNN